MMSLKQQHHHQQKSAKLPPFLKKLVDLTNSCPPHIGGWNEDGTQFIVRSSQFADLLREQFQGSLQTFVRQLHFYSFNKKDDGARGIWMFSHPHFVRGQPHLLVNIARKSNPKKKNGKDDDDLDARPAYQEPTASSSSSSLTDDRSAIAGIEAKLAQMEKRLDRVSSLEQEIESLKQELVAFKELAVAQNLLSLAPTQLGSQKRLKEDPLKSDDQLKSTEKEEALMNLQPPKKVTRLTSGDSVFELRDFPFEDTSSIGSMSVREMMRELQTDIFNDFDEFLPPASKFTSMQQATVASPAPSQPSNDTASEICQGKEEFNIPSGFEFQAGVTLPLLKQVYESVGKLCCPNNPQQVHCSDFLKKLVNEMPHPNTLPPVEMCPISRELLPMLRETVTEEANDLAIMRASRQVYEVYYQNVIKRLQDKMQNSSGGFASKTATMSAAAASQTPSSNYSSSQ